MRLTLRTLLAYMDGVLEAEDAEEIARKIDESEFATGVVNRTRDAIRRLRLGAPPLEPRGKGLDANSVAEYLDTTLTAERVADFEKLCLESDVHLAEVAACHQIINNVHCSPAEVEPKCRERMYTLFARMSKPDSSAAARAVESKSSDKPTTEDEQEAKDRPTPAKRKVEVPDYLREAPPAPKTGRIMAVVLLIVVGGAIVIGAQPSWLPGFLKFNQPAQVAQNDAGNDGAAVDDDTNQASDATAGDNQQPDNNAADNSNSQSSGGRPEGAPELNQPDNAGELGNGDAATNEPPKLDTIRDFPPLPGTDDGGATGNDNQTDADNSDNAGDTDNSVDNMTGDADATAVNDGGERELPNEGTVALPEPAEIAGQLISTDSVLLQFGGSPPSLSRAPPLGHVNTGEPLISPPDYRNVISLARGISMQTVGEAHFQFERVEVEGDPPRINLKQGRIILTNVDEPGVRIRVRTGDFEYAITFAEPGSAVAIDAKRVRLNDVTPEEQPAPTELTADFLAGHCVWESFARGGRWDLAGGNRWTQPASGQEPVVLPGAIAPEWTQNMKLTPLASRATRDVEAYLRGELAVRLRQGLLELAESKRIENRSLAVRSLAAIDDVTPAIDALNDKDFKTVWNDQVESLRKAVVRGPESAALVRIALEARRDAPGSELYRMLWGYTAEELNEGGNAARLVEYLNHDDLDFRVLALWNLQDITGITSINYHPDAPAAHRARSARMWELRLNNGQIVPGGENE